MTSGSEAGPAGSGVVDVLGVGGVYLDPLWRVTVSLTALEMDLLRSWWVRRLAFIAHAGAAAAVTTLQTYSRLEHSLGVLALVAHFAPDDALTRAAALLHDVGHLPMSHTFECVVGLDHHDLGERRIHELGPVLARHGVVVADVLATVSGARPSALSAGAGALKLDHLDSFLRSGRAHARTRRPPAATLARLELIDGAVSTDAATARYLQELIAAEAQLHLSATNAVPNGVVRHLANALLADATPEQVDAVAAMTDDEFWMLLVTNPRTAAAATSLRRDPAGWTVGPPGGHGLIDFEVTRLYLDLPLIDGKPQEPEPALFGGLPTLPWRCSISPPRR